LPLPLIPVHGTVCPYRSSKPEIALKSPWLNRSLIPAAYLTALQPALTIHLSKSKHNSTAKSWRRHTGYLLLSIVLRLPRVLALQESQLFSTSSATKWAAFRQRHTHLASLACARPNLDGALEPKKTLGMSLRCCRECEKWSWWIALEHRFRSSEKVSGGGDLKNILDICPLRNHLDNQVAPKQGDTEETRGRLAERRENPAGAG